MHPKNKKIKPPLTVEKYGDRETRRGRTEIGRIRSGCSLERVAAKAQIQGKKRRGESLLKRSFEKSGKASSCFKRQSEDVGRMCKKKVSLQYQNVETVTRKTQREGNGSKKKGGDDWDEQLSLRNLLKEKKGKLGGRRRGSLKVARTQPLQGKRVEQF